MISHCLGSIFLNRDSDFRLRLASWVLHERQPGVESEIIAEVGLRDPVPISDFRVEEGTIVANVGQHWSRVQSIGVAGRAH